MQTLPKYPVYSEYKDIEGWFDCIEGWGYFRKAKRLAGWLNFPIFNQLELNL